MWQAEGMEVPLFTAKFHRNPYKEDFLEIWRIVFLKMFKI